MGRLALIMTDSEKIELETIKYCEQLIDNVITITKELLMRQDGGILASSLTIVDKLTPIRRRIIDRVNQTKKITNFEIRSQPNNTISYVKKYYLTNQELVNCIGTRVPTKERYEIMQFLEREAFIEQQQVFKGSGRKPKRYVIHGYDKEDVSQ